MHHRNRFRGGYDFPQLIAASPALAEFAAPTGYGKTSIDFADPRAVKALNQALLKDAYGLEYWDIPEGYLCPPIPGRSDYLHHLADLLSGGDEAEIPNGPSVTVLDIGTGANGIYPFIGASEYGWRFVATDTDPVAIAWAAELVARNPQVADLIDCRLQESPTSCFNGVVADGETFTASMCNPPYHASAEEASEAFNRKRRNLGLAASSPLNFGGKSGELWCIGGELRFIQRMIAESAHMPNLCLWFTTLVSTSGHLPRLRQWLDNARVADAHVIDMSQGQKQSRILAWTFQR